MADLVSGWLCLEFANTVDNYANAEPWDFLKDFGSLVEFCQRTEVVTRLEAENQRQVADLEPERAADCLTRAKVFRRAIYDTFTALAAGGDPPAAALDLLNRLHAEAAAHARLIRSSAGFDWSWAASGTQPERLLWPIIRSAALLLTSPDLVRLRQCDGHKCTWLFLDKSKNRSRRWCTMEICGNRAKSRRHYARLHAS